MQALWANSFRPLRSLCCRGAISPLTVWQILIANGYSTYQGCPRRVATSPRSAGVLTYSFLRIGTKGCAHATLTDESGLSWDLALRKRTLPVARDLGEVPFWYLDLVPFFNQRNSQILVPSSEDSQSRLLAEGMNTNGQHLHMVHAVCGS